VCRAARQGSRLHHLGATADGAGAAGPALDLGAARVRAFCAATDEETCVEIARRCMREFGLRAVQRPAAPRRPPKVGGPRLGCSPRIAREARASETPAAAAAAVPRLRPC
jgi:hypothetical protein